MTKQYVVALDDGHGMETPGKRTPIFPVGSGLKSETGNFMHENEFNRAVVKYAKAHLERCGIRVVETAPGDSDVPLGQRTKTARAANADVFVSVHANANSGVWNNARGIDTFYQRGSSANSVRLAQTLLKHLLKGTEMLNRGAKPENFQVMRETHEYMASSLIECGFMDNIREAGLLVSDAYRRETGEEVAMAICEFLNVPYVTETVKETLPTQGASKPAATAATEVEVQVGTRPLSTKGFLRAGTTYVPVRAVSIAAGVSVGYEEKTGRVSLNEKVLKEVVSVSDVSFAPIREVCEVLGRGFEWVKEYSVIKIK